MNIRCNPTNRKSKIILATSGAYNPSIQEAEARRWDIPGYSELQCEILLNNNKRKLGVMVSSYNHSPSGRLRQEDHWEFEVCLGYKVSKDKGPGM